MAGESFEGKKKKGAMWLCKHKTWRRKDRESFEIETTNKTKQRNRELRGRKTWYKNEEGNEEIISRKPGGKKKQEWKKKM